MDAFEVAIVGGGPAGLSAALVLARARRRVVVLDAGEPRNLASRGVSGFLSRDGTPPRELGALARSQIVPYGTVEFRALRARTIESAPGRGFVVAAETGEALCSRQVLLAVGVVDLLPPIPGFAELWGGSVIHCPFCDGWENAGRAWGVLASSVQQVLEAPRCLLWTDDVMVFAPPELTLPPALVETLRARGIAIEQRPVRRLLSSRGRLCAVDIEGAEPIPRATLVHQPRQRQTALVRQLDLDLDGAGRVRVDGWQQTSNPGIFAAGDLAPGPQAVVAASAAGARAAMAMSARLAGVSLVPVVS